MQHIIQKAYMTIKNWLHCIKKNPLLSLVVALAFMLYMLVIMPSGTERCIDGRCGMHFWGAHEHDGIWHIALAQVAFHSIPFSFPTFAGAHLAGYNYLLDIIIRILSLSGLSAWDLYFRILPFIWFGIFVYVLSRYAKLYHSDTSFRFFLFFFVFFSSSLGFVIQYNQSGTTDGSSGIPTMQGALGMTNPQFMWSVLLLMLLQIILHHRSYLAYLGIVIFALLGLKIYSVVPLVVILGMSCVQLLKNREWRRLSEQICMSFFAVLFAYLVFYAGNKSGGIFFDFLSVPKQMIEDPHMWPRLDLVHQWYTLKQIGTVGPKYIQVVLQIITYFLFFNFGVRLLFFVPLGYYLYKKITKEVYMRLVLTLIVIVSTLMPILFIQSGDWWNTIQFLYFGLFFASILLADTIYIVWKTYARIGIICVLICAILFLPTQMDILRRFYVDQSSIISAHEVTMLQKLSKMKRGVVLVQPFEQSADETLASSYDTAYVAALSGKQVYFGDIKQLELLNIRYAPRQKSLLDSAHCVDLTDIEYVYLRKVMRSFIHYDNCVAQSKRYRIADENAVSKLWMRK